MGEGGGVVDEGFVPADEDGLARLVVDLGPKVRACVEMMSGAIWVRERLKAGGWEVEVADARKVNARPARRSPHAEAAVDLQPDRPQLILPST